MEKPHILLADDNPEMRSLLVDMLCDKYNVSSVCTGKELYTLMSERRDLYSVVICDIVMPHWNGDEAVNMAKTFGADIPVIFISGNANSEEIEKTSNASFLQKPIHRNDLLEKLEELTTARS